MLSEEKRTAYGGSNHFPNKVSNENEFEIRLRIIKEKYEERLEAITAKVKVIYEDIRKDDVIVTMRSDPASSVFVNHRMKEICIDHFANEREETIERLTEEVAFARNEAFRVQKEIKDLKRNIENIHENFQNERNRVLTIEAENRALKNRLAIMANDYETLQTKNINIVNENNFKNDSEKLKKELEKIKSDLEKIVMQKSQENENLVKEDEKKREKIAIQASEINKLCLELREKENSQRESLKMINDLKSELEVVKNSRPESKSRQNSFSQQFKDLLETEEKTHQDKIVEITQVYKEKSSRLKKKIIDQKKIILLLENELSAAREIVENSKHGQELSLITAQEDLKKVKEQWEKRCREIEKEHSTHLTEIQIKHQNQIADLQKHYQELLEEKIKEVQIDNNSQLSKHQAFDFEIKKLMDEKVAQIEKEYISISKHENILHQETSKLRIKHLQEIREIEENWNREIISRLKELKDQNLADNEKLSNKIIELKREKSELIAGKRNAENELSFTQEKLQSYSEKINDLKKELNESESLKKSIQQKFEESLFLPNNSV